jgi:hypothetical protein
MLHAIPYRILMKRVNKNSYNSQYLVVRRLRILGSDNPQGGWECCVNIIRFVTCVKNSPEPQVVQVRPSSSAAGLLLPDREPCPQFLLAFQAHFRTPVDPACEWQRAHSPSHSTTQTTVGVHMNLHIIHRVGPEQTQNIDHICLASPRLLAQPLCRSRTRVLSGYWMLCTAVLVSRGDTALQ